MDGIQEALKRTLFGAFPLFEINQCFPLSYSCCLGASRRTFLWSPGHLVLQRPKASLCWVVR